MVERKALSIKILLTTAVAQLAMAFSISSHAATTPANCAAAVGEVVGELAQLVAELQLAWAQGDLSQARTLHDLVRHAAHKAQAAGMSLSELPEQVTRLLNISVVRQQETQDQVTRATNDERALLGWNKIHDLERVSDMVASFSPDGKRLLTVNIGRATIIYDMTNDKENLLSRNFRKASFSPDGQQILATHLENKAVLGEIAGAEFVPKVTLDRIHTDELTSSALNFDASLVATASLDGQVVVWNAKLGTWIETFKDASIIEFRRVNRMQNRKSVRSVVFGPNSHTVLAAYEDGKARLWRMGLPEPVRIFDSHSDYLESAIFSPDGKQVAAASSNREVIIWDTDSGRTIHNLPHLKDIKAISFSPNGHEIVTAAGSEIFIWNTNSGALLHTLTAPMAKYVRHVAFSSDGEMIVGTFQAKTVVWARSPSQAVGQN